MFLFLVLSVLLLVDGSRSRVTMFQQQSCYYQVKYWAPPHLPPSLILVNFFWKDCFMVILYFFLFLYPTKTKFKKSSNQRMQTFTCNLISRLVFESSLIFNSLGMQICLLKDFRAFKMLVFFLKIPKQNFENSRVKERNVLCYRFTNKCCNTNDDFKAVTLYSCL